MSDSPSYDDLQALMASLLERLEPRSREYQAWDGEADPATPSLIADAFRTTLLALSASLGECRLATPYSPLHPVIDADGNFHWCCNHDPEHCRP